MRIAFHQSLTAVIIPPLIASLIAILVLPGYRVSSAPPVLLEPVSVTDAEGLRRLLSREDLDWPPPDTVSRTGLRHLPGDLADLATAERKRMFLASITPLVLAENRRIGSQRRFLEALDRLEGRVPDAAAPRLDLLMRRYRMEGDWADPNLRRRLLTRVDRIPPSLALAQAAVESGWGTSRFAREANNLFGIWTWDATQGLRARRAAATAKHRVRRYEDLRASVRSYMYTLNVGRAYSDLRALRARMRAVGREPEGRVLAAGLTAYSARGEAYVQELRDVIRTNDLDAADPLGLHAPHPWVVALFGPVL